MNPFFTFIRENYDKHNNIYYYSGYVGFLNISDTYIPLSEAFIEGLVYDDKDDTVKLLFYNGKIEGTLDALLNFDYPIDYDKPNYKISRNKNTKENRLTDFPDGYESARIFGFNTNIFSYKKLDYNLVKEETEKLKHELMKALK